jgi:hypothetical protein
MSFSFKRKWAAGIKEVKNTTKNPKIRGNLREVL